MTKKIQKPIPCPECGDGNLRRVLDCIEYRVLYSTGPLAPYRLGDTPVVQPIKIGDTGYIGCTQCDFMGSPDDVLRLLEPKPEPIPEEPRYHTYFVDVLPVQPGSVVTWRLLGLLGTGTDTHTDTLGIFETQGLAFAVLYRISGIKGKPGQSTYTVSLEAN